MSKFHKTLLPTFLSVFLGYLFSLTAHTNDLYFFNDQNQLVHTLIDQNGVSGTRNIILTLPEGTKGTLAVPYADGSIAGSPRANKVIYAVQISGDRFANRVFVMDLASGTRIQIPLRWKFLYLMSVHQDNLLLTSSDGLYCFDLKKMMQGDVTTGPHLVNALNVDQVISVGSSVISLAGGAIKQATADKLAAGMQGRVVNFWESFAENFDGGVLAPLDNSHFIVKAKSGEVFVGNTDNNILSGVGNFQEGMEVRGKKLWSAQGSLIVNDGNPMASTSTTSSAEMDSSEEKLNSDVYSALAQALISVEQINEESIGALLRTIREIANQHPASASLLDTLKQIVEGKNTMPLVDLIDVAKALEHRAHVGDFENDHHPKIAESFWAYVVGHKRLKNVLLIGAKSSGKSTLLNTLCHPLAVLGNADRHSPRSLASSGRDLVQANAAAFQSEEEEFYVARVIEAPSNFGTLSVAQLNAEIAREIREHVVGNIDHIFILFSMASGIDSDTFEWIKEVLEHFPTGDIRLVLSRADHFVAQKRKLAEGQLAKHPGFCEVNRDCRIKGLKFSGEILQQDDCSIYTMFQGFRSNVLSNVLRYRSLLLNEIFGVDFIEHLSLNGRYFVASRFAEDTIIRLLQEGTAGMRAEDFLDE